MASVLGTVSVSMHSTTQDARVLEFGCMCVVVHAPLRHAFDNGTAEESITLCGSDHLDLMRNSDFGRVPDAQAMYVRVPDALFERLEQVWYDQVLSEDL